MHIRVYVGVSLDGYISTPQGLPTFMMPGCEVGTSAGIHQLASRCKGMIMGRTTFDPATNQPQWPWPDTRIFVLSSSPLPPGIPDDVIVSDSPAELLKEVRDADLDGDVHLVGGQQTIQAFRDLGAIDSFGLLQIPIFLGGGTQLTPPNTEPYPLQLESTRTFSDGTIESVYGTGRQ